MGGRVSTRPLLEGDMKTVGTLDKALDQADANGWIIVDMKKDWNVIFPEK